MASDIRIRMNGQEQAFSARAAVHIGRDPQTNELLSSNPLVSRRHARLQATGGKWVIEDMGSRHGTYVNGAQITRFPVDNTVTLWLGPPGRGQLLQVLPASAADFRPSGVFISYRRGDGAGYATLLNERLVARFGASRVFRDINRLDPGTNYVARIENAIGSCAVVIILIGNNWAGTLPDGRRRLDDPDDFLRLEIATALQFGIRVIPVLVQGTTMPQAEDLPEPIRLVASRHALIIEDTGVEHGVAQLLTAVERELGEQGSPPQDSGGRQGPPEDTADHPPAGRAASVGWGWWLLAIFLPLLGGLIAWGALRPRDPKRARWLLIAGIVATVAWILVFL